MHYIVQALPCQLLNLPSVILRVRLIIVRLGTGDRQFAYIRNKQIRGIDPFHRLRVPRLKKLQNGPNGHVLKSDIGAAQNLMEICPHVVEGGIDIGSRTAIMIRQISKCCCAVSLNFRTRRIREWYEHLVDSHFQ